jgi:hypothetical protein
MAERIYLLFSFYKQHSKEDDHRLFFMDYSYSSPTSKSSPTPSSRPTCVATVQARNRVLCDSILFSPLPLNGLTKQFQCLILLFTVSWRPSTLFLMSSSSSGLVKPLGHFTYSGASPTYMLSASTLSPSANCSFSPTRKISRSFQSPGG